MSQENVHAEYFRRLDLLELEESVEQLDTKPVYRNDAMEFKHLRDSILNLEREAFIAYTNLRTQEAHNTRPTTQPNPLELRNEYNQEDRLHNITVLLNGAEIEARAAQQHKHALRSGGLISDARTSLLDFKTRHGNNIKTSELDALWASLDYAQLNTHMIILSP